MKYKFYAILTLVVALLASCDDNTDNIGSSLIHDMDKLDVVTDTFQLSSRSIVADSVLSRNTIGYLGKVRDPETGAYITSNFMTQFHIRENFFLPNKDSILSVMDGDVVADSCEMRLYYTTFYGDSLAPMKATAYEMQTPMSEANRYYSNFNPETEGLLREDGIKMNKVYTLTDLTVDESERWESGYMGSIAFKLDQPYTDRNGVTYNNFGTYFMRTYYAHPEYFKDSYLFIKHVLPGFYFKTQSGLGSMAYISLSQLNVYFQYKYAAQTSAGVDTVYIATGSASIAGTEEVLQSTTVDNDQATIAQLTGDETCTYLKTPSGIFTELTLPVDEIMSGHENDSINTAKVVLTRINNDVHSEFTLGTPQTLLLIPENELVSFFEQNKIVDYKTSFLASFEEAKNTYTFNNISNLVRDLYYHADRSRADWNKVVVIPVTVSYNTSTTTTEIVKITHDMSMTSTRLVGGSQNPYEPLQISVIYSKFK